MNSAQERFHVGRDEIVKKLDIYNIPTTVVTLQDTPHTFWLYKAWVKPAAAVVVEFLDQHFKQ